MRGRHLVWVASWLAISLSACTTLQPPRQPPRLETEKACTDWRWIGIGRPGARCPEVRGWTVRPLFPQLAASWSCEEAKSQKVPGPELIQQLNRFCVYELKDPKKGLKDLPFPPASADLVKLDKDCAALASTDRELDPKEWQADHQSFIPGGPETPLKIENKGAVRLAFLDTQPNGMGVPMTRGSSPHGFTLAHLARQLICAPDSYSQCAAQITTRLALPIVKFDPVSLKDSEIDTAMGGHIGLQSHLAEAIRDEVDDWQNAKAQRHLVLNLSVAWDGRLFSGLSGEQIAEMRAGTQAVYYALQYAASFDVLVLAAAGNQKIEPCDNFGPLLPAAWEAEAPQDGQCSRRQEKPPLVYAVGGVQHGGARLPSTRPGGMPRRAAHGETAVLLSVDPETAYKDKIYSGSSVATAHASSIAAAVWNARPDLDSHGVMRRLDDSGPELGFPADFWAGGGSQPAAHLLSLCAALEKACEGSASCPIQLPCPPASLARLAAPRSPHAEISSRGSCQPWLFPQPDDPPCLNTNCPPGIKSN